jgi:hypothetical protein
LEEGPSDFSRGIRQQHMRALIGAGRAALNRQVAFEYLTEAEVRAGIACAYPALYLPHVRSCSDELLGKLAEYVRAGGRLLADVQFGFHDPWGKLRKRGRGRLLEQLFGGWVDSIHEARTNPQAVDGIAVAGFYGDLELTTARPIKRFADGRVAVSVARVGRGSSTLMAFDPAWLCWRPGNTEPERFLADLYRGESPRRWWSDAPLVVRRSGPRSDHWFFVNDGPARTALLRVYDRRYRAGRELFTGRGLAVDATLSIPLPERSGAWVRLEKAR